MKALIATLYFILQGTPFRCDRVTKDSNGFYHLHIIDRQSKDTFNILTDRPYLRVGRCGI